MLKKLIGHSTSSIRQSPRRPYHFEALESRQMLTFLSHIGGTGFDEASFVEHAVDDAGNTYVTGRFEGTVDFDPGPGEALRTSPSRSGFVARYDSNGALDWVRDFDVDGKFRGRTVDQPRSSARAVALDGLGGVFVVGSFNDRVDLDGNGSFVTSAGDDDTFIVKLDAPTGSTTWSQTIGGSGSDRGFAVAAEDGFLYATGDFDGVVDFDTSTAVNTLTSDDGSHFVVKLDTAAGGYIDSWNFGGLSGFPKHIVPDGGNLIIAGIFTETADFDPGVNTDYRTSAGSTDWYMANYTKTGNLNWAQTIGNEDVNSEFVDVAIDDSSIYVTANFRQGTLDIDPSDLVHNLASSGRDTGFVARYDKLDGSLDTQFTPRTFGGSTSGDMVITTGGVTLDALGNIYLGFSYAGTVDLDPGPAVVTPPPPLVGGATNAAVVKLDSSGEYQSHFHVEGNELLGTAEPIRVEDGTVWVAGTFSGTASFPTGDTLTSAGGQDIFVMKISSSEPPTADAGPDVMGFEDVPVTFDGSGSIDPEGAPLTYRWDFGDGQVIETTYPTYEHTYAYGGTFNVSLTVLDGDGNAAVDTLTATIAEENDVPIAAPGGPYSGFAGTSVTFDASASFDFDNLDGTSANDEMLQFTWDFGDGTSLTVPDTTVEHTYSAVGVYEVTLTVSDDEASSPAVAIDATITDAPVGDPTDIYVWSIADAFETRQRGRNNTDHRVVLTVRNDSDGDGFAELDDDVIANVQVMVELRDADGNLVTTLTGTTDSSGVFRSDWIRGLEPGEYRADVVDLALSDFQWDPLLDVEDEQLLSI